MNLFNLNEYIDQNQTIFLIPDFLEKLNYKNYKKEIFLNEDKIEYYISVS